jgi:predicted nucleotidyltransferase
MTRLDDALERLRASLRLRPGMEQQVTERTQRLQSVLHVSFGPSEIVPIGSYARGTSTPPLHDVDMMVVLDPARIDTSTPAAMLRGVMETLRPHYPTARPQGRSVGLLFGDFSIDVVPALKTVTGYTIADVDPNDATAPTRWVATQPRAHTERMLRANERSKGIAAALVALLKHANREHATKLKSFHLETMVLDAELSFQGGFANTIHAALTALAARVKVQCVDRGGAALRLDEYLAEIPRREIAERYRNDANTFAEAMRSDDVALGRKVLRAL